MINKIPIFIINLKKDIRRRAYMESLCKQYNLQCQFIDAIYGKNLSENSISNIYDFQESISTIGRELSRGELGCALSHLKIYKLMVENDIKQAVVFEDDIQLEEGFISVIQAIDIFPNDWELVLLGHHQRKEKFYLRSQKKITHEHKLVRLAELAAGTHGYLINQKGAKKLINELNIIKKPIDAYTGIDDHINLYAISPRVISLNSTFSIDSCIELERRQINKRHHRSVGYKIKRELLRVGKQFINYIKRHFKKPARYNIDNLYDYIKKM